MHIEFDMDDFTGKCIYNNFERKPHSIFNSASAMTFDFQRSTGITSTLAFAELDIVVHLNAKVNQIPWLIFFN